MLTLKSLKFLSYDIFDIFLSYFYFAESKEKFNNLLKKLNYQIICPFFEISDFKLLITKIINWLRKLNLTQIFKKLNLKL